MIEAANQTNLPFASPHKVWSHPRLSVVSLFSGCGGMDLGFRGDFTFLRTYYDALPFTVVWANDINKAACNTYQENLGGPIHHGDVRDLMTTMPSQADVVVGGFPCQDLSINGKRRGVSGSRSGLYTAMITAVEQCQPRVFVAENVKGLLLKYNEDSLTQVLSDFNSLGYEVTLKLYLAAEYGVPQMRQRVFIVGTRPGEKSFQPPSGAIDKADWISSKQAIHDLEIAVEDKKFSHIWSLAKKSADQGSRILKADAPSDTIRAECHGNIQFHYKLNRRISMREAARMQSFPDDFLFSGGLRETERQIGNAVPPVLAWHIASAVRDVLL